ncbi:hypothetical protein HID58_041022 [Brassica napus]|uniref:Uncharacterized protein n=1 Tax=Brassica napus TaxID=3708 RepID=A0ABQ8B9N9_BRANA|nr:hypothetical protein HID58_041022 [Brassica napus]
MSNETKDLYSYQYLTSLSLYELMNLPTSTPSSYGNNGFVPSSYPLADCFQSSPGAAYDSLLHTTLGVSPSSSEVFNSLVDQESKHDVTNDVIGETPTRVSASSSSSEADLPGEDSGKSQRKRELVGDGREENQSSKKVFTHEMFRSSAYTSGGSAAAALDYGYEQSSYGSVNANPNAHQEYRQGGEYELLKEIFPSIFFKQEP